eukprot:TRINITY_DN1363_c10_g1_i1.p1 TRINITY_DN1363_c10_g1~~TRINITY_DN1363_c10_g1_i1.p1  ORF type:complete len:469 (+),score=96.82 TRINITY_DN1363_c10_g1_i1:41-1447(+)
MNFKECNEYLDTLPLFTGSGEFTLNPVAELLQKCGNPHLELPPTVHVTGTNGKGSVVAYCSHMLENCGVRCAAFVSPVPPPGYHESLIVNCNVISEEIFCAAVNHVKKALEGTTKPADDQPPPPEYYSELISMNVLTSTKDIPPPSQFEILTAVAFTAVKMLFSKGMIDCFILEVGLGGRVDSTNIIPPPVVSVITSISLDHTGILGSTEEEIAREKSGIIKSGVQLVVISRNQNVAAKAVIQKIASQKQVDLQEAGEAVVENQYFPVTENLGISEAVVRKMLQAIGRDLPTGNSLSSPALMKQVATSFMTQGRLEAYSVEDAFIIFDGAHNPAAVESLCSSIERFYNDGKITRLVLLLALLSDKDIPSLCKSYRNLVNVVPSVIIPTAVDSKRALSHTDLADQLTAAGIPKGIVTPFQTIPAAVQRARTTTSLAPKTALVVTGSFYLLRTARQLLCQTDLPVKRVQL